jgi:hypothetical protein
VLYLGRLELDVDDDILPLILRPGETAHAQHAERDHREHQDQPPMSDHPVLLSDPRTSADEGTGTVPQSPRVSRHGAWAPQYMSVEGTGERRQQKAAAIHHPIT